MTALTTFPSTEAKDRHSPCLGVCHLDAVSGLCTGCGRTGKEVADWPGASDEERLAIYARLPARLPDIGATVRLLPWTGAEILDFLATSLASGCGTWAVGTPERAASVRCADITTGTIRRDGDAVAAEIRRPDRFAALRITTHDKLRAFAVQRDGRDGPIILGLPRGRAEQLLAARLGPRRDWLLPPAEDTHAAGCACCAAPPEEATPTETVLTALASLSALTVNDATAIALMANLPALPRYAVAMAVFDPAG